MPTCIRVEPAHLRSTLNAKDASKVSLNSPSAFPTEMNANLLAKKLKDHSSSLFPYSTNHPSNPSSPIKSIPTSLLHSNTSRIHCPPASSSPLKSISSSPSFSDYNLQKSNTSTDMHTPHHRHFSTHFYSNDPMVSFTSSPSSSSSSIVSSNLNNKRFITTSVCSSSSLHIASTCLKKNLILPNSTKSMNCFSTTTSSMDSFPCSIPPAAEDAFETTLNQPNFWDASDLLEVDPSPTPSMTSWFHRICTSLSLTRFNVFVLSFVQSHFSSTRFFTSIPFLNRASTWKFKLPWNDDEIEKLKNSFVPVLSLASFFFVFLGPAYIPSVFSLICATFFPFFLAVYSSHFLRFIYAAVKIRSKLNSWKNGALPQVEFQNVHAIIIPSYCESLELLQDSISFLAKQAVAKKHFILVLAMEQREKDYAAKAQTLLNIFRDHFLDIVVTEHPKDLPGECPGKGSNVNWGARKLHEHLIQQHYDLEKVILTVADADAVMPELYFIEVEREFQASASKKFQFFTPAIFFARNPMEVPAPVRVTDAAWCVGVIQNLSNFCGLHFPCSTYSLTLLLAKHVDWWDTNEYAIGEDLHMFLKCFYLSNTQARSTPIFVPINLTNVQTDSYFSNLKARFVQARRHFQGFADSIYAFRHTFYPKNQDHSHFWVRLLCLLHVFEAQIIPAVSCLTFLAAPVSFYFYPNIVSTPLFGIISRVSKCMISPYTLLYFLYEYIHRFLDTSGIWGQVQCTRKWSQFLDLLHLPLSDILFVCLPSISLSLDAIKVLLCVPQEKFVYKVAEKHLKLVNQETSLSILSSTTTMTASTKTMLLNAPNAQFLKPQTQVVSQQALIEAEVSFSEQRKEEEKAMPLLRNDGGVRGLAFPSPKMVDNKASVPNVLKPLISSIGSTSTSSKHMTFTGSASTSLTKVDAKTEISTCSKAYLKTHATSIDGLKPIPSSLSSSSFSTTPLNLTSSSSSSSSLPTPTSEPMFTSFHSVFDRDFQGQSHLNSHQTKNNDLFESELALVLS